MATLRQQLAAGFNRRQKRMKYALATNMTAQLHDISAKVKDNVFNLARGSDFTLATQQDVSVEMAISSPDWSLYTLDFERDIAVFVELPPGSDLSEAVLAYKTQYELAQRAITMPLDAMIALAKKVQPLPKLAFLFSTARCGSTLASKIMGQIPGVWSLSEPEFLTNITYARRDLDPARAKALILAGTRLICRPPLSRLVDTVVIKPRSEPIAIAEWIVQALPDAHHAFLYRDAEGFVNSVHRFLQRAVGENYSEEEYWHSFWHFSLINGPLSLMDDYIGKSAAEVQSHEVHTLMWLLRIEGYLATLSQGIPMTPLHYRDLNEDRTEGTKALLKACGISQAHLELALRGFDKDAHEGSESANATPAKPLTALEIAEVQAMLTRLGRPNYRHTRLPTA